MAESGKRQAEAPLGPGSRVDVGRKGPAAFSVQEMRTHFLEQEGKRRLRMGALAEERDEEEFSILMKEGKGHLPRAGGNQWGGKIGGALSAESGFAWDHRGGRPGWGAWRSEKLHRQTRGKGQTERD